MQPTKRELNDLGSAASLPSAVPSIREYYTSVPSGTSEYLRSVYHEGTFSAHMSPRLSAHCAGERERCKALRSRSNTAALLFRGYYDEDSQ